MSEIRVGDQVEVFDTEIQRWVPVEVLLVAEGMIKVKVLECFEGDWYDIDSVRVP